MVDKLFKLLNAEIIKQALREKLGLPKQCPSTCLAEDDRSVWRHLEITIAFLKPVLLLPIYYKSKETQHCYQQKDSQSFSEHVFDMIYRD